MSTNPYQSPGDHRPTLPPAARDSIGRIGFTFSAIAVAGLLIVGPFGEAVSHVGGRMAFLCVPGALFSVVGLFREPRRFAACGLFLGLFGMLQLPTLYLSLFVFGRD